MLTVISSAMLTELVPSGVCKTRDTLVLLLNPAPDTVTACPGTAEDGDTVSDRGTMVIENRAVTLFAVTETCFVPNPSSWSIVSLMVSALKFSVTSLPASINVYSGSSPKSCSLMPTDEPCVTSVWSGVADGAVVNERMLTVGSAARAPRSVTEILPLFPLTTKLPVSLPAESTVNVPPAGVAGSPIMMSPAVPDVKPPPVTVTVAPRFALLGLKLT